MLEPPSRPSASSLVDATTETTVKRATGNLWCAACVGPSLVPGSRLHQGLPAVRGKPAGQGRGCRNEGCVTTDRVGGFVAGAGRGVMIAQRGGESRDETARFVYQGERGRRREGDGGGGGKGAARLLRRATGNHDRRF